MRVLHEDYSIDCGTDAHALFQLLAAAIAVGFSAGVPVALIVVLVKRARAHNAVTPTDRFVARRVAEELQLDDKMAIDAINDIGMVRLSDDGEINMSSMKLCRLPSLLNLTGRRVGSTVSL